MAGGRGGPGSVESWRSGCACWCCLQGSKMELRQNLVMISSRYTTISWWSSFLMEGSFAEVGQVITGTKFSSFLTPDIASKKMPDMASGYPNMINLMPCLA